jgi:nicotinate-nucleotide adenylyltransferase
VLEAEPFVISSTEICALLPERKGREYLSDSVYSYIIKNRLYGAKPDFNWLREKGWSYLKKSRIPHVMGCEQKAVELAELYGADVDDARTAAILHDSTKKLSPEEQLKLCDTYGIINDKS